MIAGLPMYARPETADAHDRYWSLIRTALADHGIAAPRQLTRETDPWVLWLRPDLVMAQTCGLPYRARLHGRVSLVGTPDFGLPDTAPGYYFSEIIVRECDPRDTVAAFQDATLAYNDAQSQSGWAAVCATGARFAASLLTGAHRESVRAVAGGRADIAAIDAVCWRDLQRYESDLTDRLRSIGRTAPTPGLPYIAAKDADATCTAHAVAAAVAQLCPADRDTLRITALAAIPAADYLALPLPPGP